jgi:hypothetical protein
MTAISLLAQYSDGGPVGILPKQSMFATDSTRQGIFDARSSFVRLANIIFARNQIAIDRSIAVGQLNVTTPIAQYLTYRRPSGFQDIEPIPPIGEWSIIVGGVAQSYQVHSIEERDFLLLDPTFLSYQSTGLKPRVLVNGLGNLDAPQWSVYEATVPAFSGDPIFKLALSYDYSTDTIADRDLLVTSSPPITTGQRVYVAPNTSTNGFWTVWQYVGLGQSGADDTGFKLVRYQTYDTSDFWSFIDWYATGYSSNEPPVVRYATQQARDFAENPNPKTIFVRVDNDGTGKWIWTAFADGIWTIVARQSGTIAFSTQFYDDPTRPTIGFDPVLDTDLSLIPIRDGSWEFKVLFDLLQDAVLLEPLEVNEIFFSMVHFVHAQQDQVPWAFKTSFLNVGGYNEALTQTPVEPIDNTTNLLDYLAEVAPYRVHIREFTRIVTPNMENAVVQATDFDFPLYYDPTTGKYRNLDISNPNDLAIVQTTRPWSDWYKTYQQPETRPEDYEAAIWNGVRHFTITMLYDRVDHFPILESQSFLYNAAAQNALEFPIDTDLDLRLYSVEVSVNGAAYKDNIDFVAGPDTVSLLKVPSDGSTVLINVRDVVTPDLAADRIQRFYDPTNVTAAEKNLRTLMGLNFKGNVDDGGALADNSVNDYTISGVLGGTPDDEFINPDGNAYTFADPALEADRPEELVVAGSGESLRILERNSTRAFAELPANYNNASLVANTISTARPGTDLMAPNEVGDFDARPFDTLEFDVGFTGEQGNQLFETVVRGGVLTQLAIGTLPEDRDLFVLRHDAFEQIAFSNVGGVLVNDVLQTSNAVTIMPLVAGMLPFTIPVIQTYTSNTDTKVETTNPGVVWINDERVEFFDYTVNDDDSITLTEIRRGTHNTRIGVEQRINVRFPSRPLPSGTISNPNIDDSPNPSLGGTTTIFDVANTTAVGLTVSVNETLRYTTGAQAGDVLTVDGYTGYPINVAKTLGTDYTVTTQGSGVRVTFKTAPPSGSIVFISNSTTPKHPAGSVVYNGARNAPPAQNIIWITMAGNVPTTEDSNTGVLTGSVAAATSSGASVVYALTGGSLPPSWTFNTDGSFNGVAPTPTQNTTYSFQVTATSGQLQTIRTFSLFFAGIVLVPSVVQGQVRALNTTEDTVVTMNSPVTAGNVIVVIVTSPNTVTAGDGWITLETQSGVDNTWIGYLFVQASGATVFIPTSVTGGGTVAAWEVTNQANDWATNPPTFSITGLSNTPGL